MKENASKTSGRILFIFFWFEAGTRHEDECKTMILPR